MPEVKLVVIGSTGSGKSSLCNVLAGMDSMGSETGGFPVSEKLSACTFQTTCRHVRWMGLGEEIMLIDTPGLDDPEGKDTEHIAEMVDKLKEVRHVNLFLIIFNAQRPRMDSSLRSMFRIFQGIFGPGFWANTAILFSRWAFDSRSEKQRQREGMATEKHEMMVNEFFRSSFNLSRRIPCVFVDSCYLPEDPGEMSAFRRETLRLRDILMMMQPYECKDFEKVLSEMDDLKQQKDTALKEKETAEFQATAANEEKQKAVHEKGLAEDREKLANVNLENVKAQLSDFQRESLEKLQKANEEKERIQQEAFEQQNKAEESRRDAERLRLECERKAAEDKRLMEQEFKSIQERMEMQETLRKEKEARDEQLREAEKAEMEARHQAELLEERRRMAEREAEAASKQANDSGLFSAIGQFVGGVFDVISPIKLGKKLFK